jgi:hypothetical protein
MASSARRALPRRPDNARRLGQPAGLRGVAADVPEPAQRAGQPQGELGAGARAPADRRQTMRRQMPPAMRRQTMRRQMMCRQMMCRRSPATQSSAARRLSWSAPADRALDLAGAHQVRLGRLGERQEELGVLRVGRGGERRLGRRAAPYWRTSSVQAVVMAVAALDQRLAIRRTDGAGWPRPRARRLRV